MSRASRSRRAGLGALEAFAVRGALALLAALTTIPVVLVALPAAASAQERPSPDSIAVLQRRMMEAALPGPAHERLATLAGEWDLEVRMRPRPGMDPVVLEGTARNFTILDGRFLVSTTRWGPGGGSGEEAGGEGGPGIEEGWTILGYDGRSGEHTVVLLDTWGTYWVTSRGTSDPAAESIVMGGEEADPILGHTQVYDIVLAFDDEDTYRLSTVFHDEAHTGGGEPFTALEIVHRRRAGGVAGAQGAADAAERQSAPGARGGAR